MRVIFMGTPDFAVGTLEAIIAAGHEVVLVVTQPDKPKGRGNEIAFPPVKECAIAHGIEVFQPTRVKLTENVEYLRKYNPDIIIVAAFGQLLPQAILEMPKYGCVNVHASLLPKYRGAAPIQWAVINGDEITGVTTMRMDIGLDTGDMIAKKQIRLAEDETGGSLFDKLAVLGAELCVETMDMIEQGTATYIPQNHEASTHTTMISKELGDIDWTKSARSIECLIRGLNPWPSAYSFLDGKMLKIWAAKVVEDVDSIYAASKNAGLDADLVVPGSVLLANKEGLFVQTGDGILCLKEVQLQGKKRMDCGAFLNGYTVKEGVRL